MAQFIPGAQRFVTVVNRARDGQGRIIPYHAHYGGEAFVIEDAVEVPEDIADILVHHSMRRYDPATQTAEYTLGCEARGAPTDPIRGDEKIVELVDRSDPLVAARKVEVRKIMNPIRRRDPLAVGTLGDKDGAYPAHYGDPQRRQPGAS